LRKEILFMHAPSRPTSSLPADEKQMPIATFKTSLRVWQARYKAQLAAQALVLEKGQTQTTPV
jgi:hypothetical protein